MNAFWMYLFTADDRRNPFKTESERLRTGPFQAALMNSPRQRRKGARGTPTMKELQFLVEHHLYKQQQQQQHGGGGADECSSESLDCLSDRPSPDCCHGSTDLPEDDGIWSSEAFEKLQSRLETPGGESEASVTTEPQSGALKEEGGVAREATAAQQTAPGTESSLHSA
ncbi:UNVERIFIED_CONTAM: hypothetical protein FKN15_053757 [Acipenser sinensis]